MNDILELERRVGAMVAESEQLRARRRRNRSASAMPPAARVTQAGAKVSPAAPSNLRVGPGGTLTYEPLARSSVTRSSTLASAAAPPAENVPFVCAPSWWRTTSREYSKLRAEKVAEWNTMPEATRKAYRSVDVFVAIAARKANQDYQGGRR